MSTEPKETQQRNFGLVYTLLVDDVGRNYPNATLDAIHKKLKGNAMPEVDELLKAAQAELLAYTDAIDNEQTAGRQALDAFLAARLDHMEQVLADRTWLTGAFSVADILMSDVLHLVDRFDGLAEYPACRAYVERATARPAFKKAHADQMEHFAAAD